MADTYYNAENLTAWQAVGHLTSHEVEAMLTGFAAGEASANFADAYGGPVEQDTPIHYADVSDRWQEAFAAGVESWQEDREHA